MTERGAVLAAKGTAGADVEPARETSLAEYVPASCGISERKLVAAYWTLSWFVRCCRGHRGENRTPGFSGPVFKSAAGSRKFFAFGRNVERKFLLYYS